MDECELANACGTNALCQNTDGGHRCTCPAGFAGDPKVACVDVDECALARSGDTAPVCGRSAICDNLPGSFRCQCPPGSKGDPRVACEGNVWPSRRPAVAGIPKIIKIPVGDKTASVRPSPFFLNHPLRLVFLFLFLFFISTTTVAVYRRQRMPPESLRRQRDLFRHGRQFQLFV